MSESIETEVSDDVGRKLMSSCNNPLPSGDATPSVEAGDEPDTTFAKFGSGRFFHPSHVVDVDSAKWNSDYSKRLEANLERFKKLGLYSKLQEMGIIYDPTQFRKSYSMKKNPEGGIAVLHGGSEVYDETEKSFDSAYGE